MVEAATQFRKNSFNDSDSATLAKVATTFQNVADESVSAADSASFIIAQMKAFNIEADNAEHIIDAVNAVSNNYAVSSGQLAQNLGNMSAAMATGNNTFEQSLGMLTAMTEITRNAAKGSRALITVQGRLNQIVDESSDIGKALTAWYQEHAIAVKDDKGQIRSLYDVLADVAKIWPTLTKNEQMYYLQQQAGTTQTQNLAALLTNYQTAIQATNTALESNGSAMKENERYMESLQAKEQLLKAEFEDFSNRVLSKDLVSGFLDAGYTMLSFANNDVVAVIARVGGFAAALTALVGIVGTVIAAMAKLSATLAATAGGGGLLATLLAPKTLAIIAAVAVAVAGLAEVFRGISGLIAEANKAIQDHIDEYNELGDKVQEISGKYDYAKSRLQEINETPWEDRTADIDKEAEYLERVIAYYEKLLDIQQKAQIAEGASILSKDRVEGVSVGTTYSNLNISGIDNTKVYKDMADALWDIADAEISVTRSSATNSQAIIAQKIKLIDLIEVTGDYEADTKALSEAAKKYGITIKENTVSQDEAAKSNAEYYKSLYTYYGMSKNIFDSPRAQTKRWAEEVDNAVQSGKQYYEIIKQQIDAGNQVSDALMDEYNSYQQLVAVQTIANSEGRSFSDVADTIAQRLSITKDEAYELYKNLGDLAGSIGDATSDMDSKLKSSAETVLRWADMIQGATDAKTNFDNAMSQTGDYDDAFKGLVSVFSTLNDEFEAGQIGSLTFRNALSQLVGDDILTGFDNASDKAEYMAGIMDRLSTLYSDAESGGLGFVTVMQELADAGELAGATLDTTGDSISYNITDFDQLADSMGLTTSQLWALIEAGKVYGADVDWNIDALISAFNNLDSSIVTVKNGVNEIDFTKVVEGLSEVGYSKDTILDMKRYLEDVDNVRLTNVPDSIDDIIEKAGETESATAEMTSELEDLNSTSLSGITSQVRSLGDQLLRVSNQAQNAKNNIQNLGGTRYQVKADGGRTKEGPSLVNEDGPELIQSGNEAYIAGNGMPTIAQVHDGDYVYTAEETRAILNGKKLHGAIQAHRLGHVPRISSNRASRMSPIKAKGKIPKTSKGRTTSGSSSASSYSSTSSSGSSGSSSASSYSSTSSSGSSGSSSSSSSGSSKSSKDAWKDEFDAWLEAKKHALAMDEISETQYYKELEEMNNKYFQGRQEYQKEYWKYQEDIYKWEKSQLKDNLNAQLKALKETQSAILKSLKETQSAINDKYNAEIKALENTNNKLEDQIKYEGLLKNLAEARSKRAYTFKDGRYQYTQDYDAIATAQEALNEYNRSKSLEAKKSAIEAKRDAELAKVIKQQDEINKELSSITGYANGTLSSTSGLHMVGENGPELRVLNSGDGIIPSNITKNLWNLGRSIIDNKGIAISNRNPVGMSMEFNNTTMSFPNIQTAADAKKFVENVKALAYQRAFSRR